MDVARATIWSSMPQGSIENERGELSAVRPDGVKLNVSPIAEMIPTVLMPSSRLVPSTEAQPVSKNNANGNSNPGQTHPATRRMAISADPDIEGIGRADREGRLVR